MFYVPLHPSDRAKAKAKRAVVVIISITSTVAAARVVPGDVVLHLADGFKDGFQTLLIEHLLKHWGEITVAVGAAGAHHFHD